MGFFKTLFGVDDGDSHSAGGFSGGSTVSRMTMTQPAVSTETRIDKGTEPKKPEEADLSGYYETERNRKRRNGLQGTFTARADENDKVGA